jgi:hypothetical protein
MKPDLNLFGDTQPASELELIRCFVADPSVAHPPAYTQAQVERGMQIAFLITLLRVWNRPASREALEAGLTLMLNDDIRQVLLGRRVPFAPDYKAVTGFDNLLAGLAANNHIVLNATAAQQLVTAGAQAPALTKLRQADVDKAKEVIQALEAIKKDRRKVTDTCRRCGRARPRNERRTKK